MNNLQEYEYDFMFCPKENLNLYKVVGTESIETAIGIFECTIVEGYGDFDGKINLVKIEVAEQGEEFIAFAQEDVADDSQIEYVQDENDLADILEENKKLREELEKQGKQIADLNKQVD